ncbi:hypothetical protein SAMN04489740_2721 [Arthrobacter alpinus]|uniref:Uncharacterized protein n=1 Tax=Arthrobacter alpinus TaxID=656366 RepID=A0A1H5M2T1_9MICC|nr:hypothetical protein [Arthrobacter alpinus]SEE83500.1 hypothetical protein SAMN04489740_2721 [Arthrobacter alpinus]
MTYKHVDRTEFRRQFDAGLNHAELTAHFGCNPATTSRMHKRLELPPFAGTQNWFTDERRQEVKALLDDGCSFAEIIRTTGVHVDTLNRHFPGCQWTKQECIDYTTAVRRINEGPRKGIRQVHYDAKRKMT